MKTIAIIPARGGSKRIPKKNIKDFHGKPLIAYSIETAKKSGLFDHIVVSTDDEEIAVIAEQYGATIPFIRPAELADDFTGTDAVIQHTLDFFAQHNTFFDYQCTLYPTAPFLSPHYLSLGFDKLRHSDAYHSFSCTDFSFPIHRSFTIKHDRAMMFFPEHYYTRSQDLPSSFHDAGQFYWTTRLKPLPKNDIMFSSHSIPIVLPRYLVCDIDTPEDFDVAWIMYELLQKRGLLG